MGVTEQARLKLTYEDYVLYPDNGMIHELIDGEHYTSPAPETYHQKVSRRIRFQLYVQIEEKGLGEVINCPVDVQFTVHDVVQPDIVVVLKRREQIISPKKILGAPDLVIEILSESSGTRDRKLKMDLYEKGGVPEYWIVDPWEHFVSRYRLRGGRYMPPEDHRESIPFDGVPGVLVDLARVW